MSALQQPNPAQRPRRWRRWSIRAGIILLLAVIGLCLAAPSGIGWIIGYKLQGELATRMKAQLTFTRLRYEFPYGVRLEKAHLLLPGINGGPDSWVSVGALELTLAKVPIGPGPLVIQRLAIDKPLVHLAANYSVPESSEPSSPPTAPTEKLSDLFQLRKLTVTGGQFEYDMSRPGHPLPPVVWGHLGADMDTQATSGSRYKFSALVQDQPVAVASASGSFDIDELQLNLDRFSATVTADPAKRPPQVPPQILDLMQKYRVGGQLTLRGSAQMPLNSLDQTRYDAALSLTDAHCQPPGFAAPVVPTEFSITSSNQGGSCTFNLVTKDQDLASVTAIGTVDLDSLTLALSKLEMAVECDPEHPIAQLPAGLANLLHESRVGGRLFLTGTARLPMKSPGDGTYDAKIELQRGQYLLPGWAEPIHPVACTITAKDEAGHCTFDLRASDHDLATASASGSLDLQNMLLDLGSFNITLNCDPAKPETQLPPSLAKRLKDLHAGGQLIARGCARVPLGDPMRGLYAATIDLKNAYCTPPGWSGPVKPATLSIAMTNIPGATGSAIPKTVPLDLPEHPAQTHLRLNKFRAEAGDQLLAVTSGQLDFDSSTNAWALSKLVGTADVGDGPGPLEGANARIIIPFAASGSGRIGNPISSVRIALDDGSVVVTPNHIRLNRINGLLTARAGGLSSSDITATCAEGKIKAAVNLRWRNLNNPRAVLAYNGSFDISKLDLHQLAMEYTTDSATRQKAFGQLDWHQDFQGLVLADSPDSGPDSVPQLFSGSGDLDITNGYFMDIPVLKDIVGAMNMRNASTVGEAAATFDVADGVITFTRIAANSPALGVQGHGTLDFNQQAKMDFVATPLADWSKDLKGAGLINNAAAGLVGKVQDVFNGLQGQLYTFRVTGPITNPKVESVAVPFLVDKVNPLFHKMASDQTQGSVASELKKQRAENGGK